MTDCRCVWLMNITEVNFGPRTTELLESSYCLSKVPVLWVQVSYRLLCPNSRYRTTLSWSKSIKGQWDRLFCFRREGSMHSKKSWAQMDFSVFSNFSAPFDNNR